MDDRPTDEQRHVHDDHGPAATTAGAKELTTRDE
jgi:hypothetical protein